MNEQQLLKEIIYRENQSQCFNLTIDGVTIHPCLSEDLRMAFIESHGEKQMQNSHGVNSIAVIKTFVVSVFHLSKLLLSFKRFDNFIYSFARVDKVGDYYLDKFTDPVIERSNIKKSYIIFERSRGGKHSSPRFHNEHIVYSDAIDIFLDIHTRLFYLLYYRQHKSEFDRYFDCINDIYGKENVNKTALIKQIYYRILKIRIYQRIFIRLGIRRFFSVSRNYFLTLLCAAKNLNIPTYEFQHGITYAETTEYSGFRHPKYTPDKFLAFGDNDPKDVYGIDVNNIVEIGWAFDSFTKSLCIPELSSISSKDVLVISDPNVTQQMIDSLVILAIHRIDINFYLRCHPMEIITKQQLALLDKYKNIHIQDKSINIAIVMNHFANVIGESSTVLYEALSSHKKVGKLFMSGMTPRYLTEDDKSFFWEIKDVDTFDDYIADSVDNRVNKTIFTEFRTERIDSLLA